MLWQPLNALVQIIAKARVTYFADGGAVRAFATTIAVNNDAPGSRLSYLAYRNGDFEGGSATLRDYGGKGESRRKIEYVKPPLGSPELFVRHER